MASAPTRRKPKLDPILAGAIDQAREAAEAYAKDFGVGEHIGLQADEERAVTHLFACDHPGYSGWHWAVSMVRASRGKRATVNEVELLPTDSAVLPPHWVPWEDRIQGGDIAPGLLLPTLDNDPRLEAGFTGGELAADADPAEWSQTRAVVAELGLGRERVLSREGRDMAAERWLEGDGGPENQMTRQAPDNCLSCGYFLRLQGGLGMQFGVCGNEFSDADGRVVSVDHGCGGHSSVVAEERGIELPLPVYHTIEPDYVLFD